MVTSETAQPSVFDHHGSASQWGQNIGAKSEMAWACFGGSQDDGGSWQTIEGGGGLLWLEGHDLRVSHLGRRS